MNKWVNVCVNVSVLPNWMNEWIKKNKYIYVIIENEWIWPQMDFLSKALRLPFVYQKCELFYFIFIFSHFRYHYMYPQTATIRFKKSSGVLRWVELRLRCGDAEMKNETYARRQTTQNTFLSQKCFRFFLLYYIILLLKLLIWIWINLS